MPRSRLAAQAMASVRHPLTRQENPPHFTYPNGSTAVPPHELPDSENPNHTSRVPARAPHSGPRQPSTQQPLHSATHPARNTTLPPYTSLAICLYNYTNISLFLHPYLLVSRNKNTSQSL